MTSSSERLAEGDPEARSEERTNRLKQEVASGAHACATAASTATPDDVVSGARPKATSGTFDKNDKSPGREVFDLAWPIAAAMLGETAMGLVDTKLVGGLGASALGGVGIATTIMFLCYSIVFGLMRGVKVRTAHAIGEERPEEGFVYARAGVLMGALVGTAILIACRDISPLLRAIGADASIIPYARDFLAAITLGAPFACVCSALIQHRQAIGDSRTQMIVGISGNVVNAVLAWILIYGRFGAPALGVRGAGYATATTLAGEAAVLLVLLARLERREKTKSALGFREATRGVAELGVPTGMQFGAEMLAFTTFTAVLSGIGKEEIAGHQIALNVIRVSFLPGVAVAEAASVLVGRSLGRRSLAEADAVVKRALQIAVGFMAICGVAFAVAGGLFAEFFSKDPAVVTIARRLLLVAAVFQVLDAVNIVFRGSLRGAKDVRAVMILGILVVWTCIPTSAWLFGRVLGLGALGGWIGFVFETTIGSLLFFLRWKRGGWRDDYKARA